MLYIFCSFSLVKPLILIHKTFLYTGRFIFNLILVFFGAPCSMINGEYQILMTIFAILLVVFARVVFV